MENNACWDWFWIGDWVTEALIAESNYNYDNHVGNVCPLTGYGS